MFEILFSLESPLSEKLNECIKGAVEIWIISAYLEDSGFAVIKEALEQDVSNRKINIVTSNRFDFNKNKSIVDFCENNENVNLKVNFYAERFLHVKLYAFKSENELAFITGSSNLTYGGIINNLEVNCLVRVDIESEISKSLLRIIEKIWSYSHPLNFIRSHKQYFKLSSNKKHMKLTITKEVEERIVSETICWIKDTPNLSEELNSDWEDIDSKCDEFKNEIINNGIANKTPGKLKRFFGEKLWALDVLDPKSRSEILDLILKNQDLQQMFNETLAGMEKQKPDYQELFWFLIFKKNGKKRVGIGESIASEILFRLSPKKFPIKNKKNDGALSLLFSIYEIDKAKNVPYAEYYKIVLDTWSIIKEVFEQKNILNINEDGKLRCVDKFHQYIYYKYQDDIDKEGKDDDNSNGPLNDDLLNLQKMLNKRNHE